MTSLRVHLLSISLDGYAAGPDQTVDNPLGVGGEALHEWMFAPDNEADRAAAADFVRRSREGLGASIMGRNMFGPVRGAWPDDSWRGWWGEDPPYHHPVFVLTHHERAPQPMAGGTEFHFVTDGPGSAYEQAATAAQGKDIWLLGGASTVRQYLAKGLVDEMHLVVVPILLGSGERLLGDLDGATDGFTCVEHIGTPMVTHLVLRRAT